MLSKKTASVMQVDSAGLRWGEGMARFPKVTLQGGFNGTDKGCSVLPLLAGLDVGSSFSDSPQQWWQRRLLRSIIDPLVLTSMNMMTTKTTIV